MSVIVDAMAEVQSLDKHKQIRKCLHLAHYFICLTFEKYGDSNEMRLTFDTYDIPAFLKQATCLKRQGQQKIIYYSFVAKLSDKCFCWFPATMFVSLRRAETWHLHTKLYKFG